MAARLIQYTSSKWIAINRSPVTRSCMYREKRCRAAIPGPQARVERSMLARTSRGSRSICAGLNGSSEGVILRAEAGRTPANPSRNTIANMVADSFQVMFNFSRNHPLVQHLALCVGHLGEASDCHSFHFTYVPGLLFRLPAHICSGPLTAQAFEENLVPLAAKINTESCRF